MNLIPPSPFLRTGRSQKVGLADSVGPEETWRKYVRQAGAAIFGFLSAPFICVILVSMDTAIVTGASVTTGQNISALIIIIFASILALPTYTYFTHGLRRYTLSNFLGSVLGLITGFAAFFLILSFVD